jgi:hypothetical protein
MRQIPRVDRRGAQECLYGGSIGGSTQPKSSIGRFLETMLPRLSLGAVIVPLRDGISLSIVR